MNWNTGQRPAAGNIAARAMASLGFAALSCALLLSACQKHPQQEPSLGVAYAGPVTLNLRQDLSSRSPAVTTVKHGEVLQIMETRRRFVRVRTADGSQGWTEANLLLSSQQMDALKQLARRAAAMPSQGAASVSEPLNVHSEPARLSPSFFQIPEGTSVEVVGHRIAPRQAPAPPASVVRRKPEAKKARGKQIKAALLIPPPAPPSPPPNWIDLSRPRAADLPDYVPPSPPAPVATDDWSLVRTRDGTAGWALSRMLFMSVPDEVAQYAEGHRITAYLPLGDVKDGDQIKHNWLWTTITPGNKCCEFDSFRVFVWSIKHHRYETAYIERNVSGFYPVQVADAAASGEKGFSLVIQEKDGKLYKRAYAFAGYHVRMVGREPVAPAVETGSGSQPPPAPVATAPPARSLWVSLAARFGQWWRNGTAR